MTHTASGQDLDSLRLRAAVAMELKRRKEEERLRYYRPHAKQREVHRTHLRFRGVLGGNRTGKTVCGAIETVLFALGPYAERYVLSWDDEDKEWWYRRFGNMYVRQREQVWVATVNWDLHRDVTQQVLLDWLPKPEIERITYRKPRVIDFIELKNGRRIVFKSYETGATGFYGASVPFIWLDEEPPYEIWSECEKRVMDCKGHILMTFTPLQGITWSHDRIYLNTRHDPETWCIHFSWDDNPHLDEGEKQRLLSQMSPEEIEARVYGRYLLPGGTVFDGTVVLDLRSKVQPGTPTVVDGTDVEIEVWEPPQRDTYYVLGADVAEGLPSGDNSALCVIRHDNGKQVAEFASNRMEPQEFADLIYQVGMWYNNAFVVVERNNDGKVVLARLRERQYPNLYVHRLDLDRKDELERWGFPTTARTRPLLIALGQEVLREAPWTISSPKLVEEMTTFIRDSHGRPQAVGKGQRGGKTDDRIFAWLLALWGRDQYNPRTLRPLRPVRLRQQSWKEADWVSDSQPEVSYARWNPLSFLRWPSRTSQL